MIYIIIVDGKQVLQTNDANTATQSWEDNTDVLMSITRDNGEPVEDWHKEPGQEPGFITELPRDF